MTMRVQRIGDQYCVVLSAEVLEALHLVEGSEVEVRPIISAGNEDEHRYASVEECLEAFRKTEPLHRETYRELAKR
jgi:antitoxin component of MazEF toxin-antitoxin module